MPTPRAGSFPTDLVGLTAFMRREGRRAALENADWRATVDELRPFTGDVWAEMPMADKARFLRHLRPWWEIHRHRMAAPVADRIDAAIARGQLTLHGGRIRSFDIAGDRVTLSYRVRGTSDVRQITAARVVNCSEPVCGLCPYLRISADPQPPGLTRHGLRPDPLCLGLDVTRNCALKDAKGAISGRLFAVGPVTKATFWEMTAVPDIRRQCEYLANHLSVLWPDGGSEAEGWRRCRSFGIPAAAGATTECRGLAGDQRHWRPARRRPAGPVPHSRSGTAAVQAEVVRVPRFNST